MAQPILSKQQQKVLKGLECDVSKEAYKPLEPGEKRRGRSPAPLAVQKPQMLSGRTVDLTFSSSAR